MIHEFTATWLTVVIAAVVGVIGISGFFAISFLVAPRRPSDRKAISYESGIIPSPIPRGGLQIRYYIFALLFLIFDVESVFVFPWAVIFLRSVPSVFYVMVAFLAILMFGLIYEWRKGALSWR